MHDVLYVSAVFERRRRWRFFTYCDCIEYLGVASLWRGRSKPIDAYSRMDQQGWKQSCLAHNLQNFKQAKEIMQFFNQSVLAFLACFLVTSLLFDNAAAVSNLMYHSGYGVCFCCIPFFLNLLKQCCFS